MPIHWWIWNLSVLALIAGGMVLSRSAWPLLALGFLISP